MSANDYDVLIVGGGIQGVGVCQAAAAEGRRVLLLEAREIAWGTSSRSSKLIHGGLRYLETAQFGLVRESLAERRILLQIAPELVELVPFYIPIYRATTRRPWQIRAGLSIYAILGNLRASARFNAVPRRDWETLDGLVTEDLQAVYRYHDGQTDDAALARAVLRSAVELGARVEAPAELVRAERDADGYSVRYTTGETEATCRCTVLVNAAGPWVNLTRARIEPEPPGREVDLVAGTHVEYPGEVARGIYYVEAPTDRRAVFVMPWKGHTLVGTTETPFKGDPAAIEPRPREVTYLGATLQHYFPTHDAEPLKSWAGLRVLPRGRGRAFNRPRDVTLVTDGERRPHTLAVYGGKLTGYRATALKVMKRIAPSLPPAKRIADTSELRLT